MQYPDFFTEVEARVGVAAPQEVRPDSRPSPWIRDAEDSPDATAGRTSERFELVDSSDDALGQGDPASWPDDRYDPEHVWDLLVWDDKWVDAIAAYRPWHAFRSIWGIVINEYELGCFAAAIAEEAKAHPARVAPFVLRQVLAHEFVHFGFEVAATEIQDLLGEPLYLAYLHQRFGAPNRWSTGPLEEIVATWSESLFARDPAPPGLGRKPRGYASAVTRVNRGAPDGYCDFELMAHPRRGERIVADVAGLIADRDLWNPRWWPRVGPDDTAQVPLYWQGDPGMLELFGVGKQIGPIAIRTFEKWLFSVVGAVQVPGTKHAKAELPNGRRITYTNTGAELYPPEAQIARKVGLRNRRDLHEHVMSGRRPASLVET